MSKRKKLIIAISVFFAVLIGLTAVYIFVISPSEEPDEPEYENIRRFYTEEPDWETDILGEEDYLVLNRDLYYSNGMETFKLTDGGSTLPESVYIFDDYLQAIIMGEREKVNTYYTDEFIGYIEDEADKDEEKRHPYYRCVTEDFTMQRLYDMKVTFVGKPVDEETGEQYDYYILEYKISLNNGTFLDIVGENLGGHDVSAEQHVKVVERGGEYKITSIGFSIPQELE